MTDQDAQHDDQAPPAHASDENPLDHIGEPVADPVLDGSQEPATTQPTEG